MSLSLRGFGTILNHITLKLFAKQEVRENSFGTILNHITLKPNSLK